MAEIDIHCDVLVTGGGSAGLAAAVSAARQGAKVILLERNSYIGGKATAAIVGTICGLYYRSENPVSRFVSHGFAKEFAEKLQRRSKLEPIQNKVNLHFLPYDPFDFKIISDEYVERENMEVFFHTTISSVNKNADKIKSVSAIAFDRRVNFYPKAVIDCTGEAMVSSLAEINIIEAEEYQASAQVFSMTGIEAPHISEEKLGMSMMLEIQRAIQEGRLMKEYNRLSIVPGSLDHKNAYLKIGIPEKISNETNKVTRIEFTARQMVRGIADFLISNVAEFKNAKLLEVAKEAGIRTGRRSLGLYTLTKEDVLSCRRFEHVVARGAWPIEEWNLDKRVHMDYFEMDNYYEIPADCLVSGQLKNLFFAGRNISATETAMASARVIATCMDTGYAAGIMASAYIKEGSYISGLQEIRKYNFVL